MKQILKMEDMKPKEGRFELEDAMGQGKRSFTLRKFSIADRIWAKQNISNDLGVMFEKNTIEDICGLAWHLLKEKEFFENSSEKFLQSIFSLVDQDQLKTALLLTIGVDDKVIKKLEKLIDEEKKETPQTAQMEKEKPTGQSHSTK